MGRMDVWCMDWEWNYNNRKIKMVGSHNENY